MKPKWGQHLPISCPLMGAALGIHPNTRIKYLHQDGHGSGFKQRENKAATRSRGSILSQGACFLFFAFIGLSITVVPGHVDGERVLSIAPFAADAAEVDEPPREVDGLDVHSDTVFLLVGFATGFTDEISSHRIFSYVIIKHCPTVFVFCGFATSFSFHLHRFLLGRPLSLASGQPPRPHNRTCRFSG